ncbi:MAG: M20/M25/M40 family metallo-hydrolase [Planctomycetota bacterium]
MKYNLLLNTLNDIVKIPSVSAAGLKTKPIKQTAEFVIRLFKENGFNTILNTIKGNPIIYAERIISPAKPTIIFYNHYDVQPPDPLNEWISGPFKPTVRSGKLFGRGVSDNKGNLIARLAAVKSFIDAKLQLSVNIKFLVEGAEEIGSPGLSDFIRKYRSKLSADVCVWEFGKRNDKGVPELSLGVKGIIYVQLSVKGPKDDLHSSLGITIPNPAWRLNWALASLKDSRERILIKGFYDNCLPLTAADIKVLSPGLLNEALTKKEMGINKFLLGLTGKPLLKRHFYQPALNINGLTSGYQGPGHKTVLPKQASAKIDFRLVPNQNPQDILKKLRRHLDSKGFNDVKISYSDGYPPGRTAPNHPFIRKYMPLLNTIAKNIFGHKFIIEPISPTSGPMYLIDRHLKIPCIAFGFGVQPGANIHAPNENIILSDYNKGVKFIVELFKKFSNY